jgi:hypothetical protein
VYLIFSYIFSNRISLEAMMLKWFTSQQPHSDNQWVCYLYTFFSHKHFVAKLLFFAYGGKLKFPPFHLISRNIFNTTYRRSCICSFCHLFHNSDHLSTRQSIREEKRSFVVIAGKKFKNQNIFMLFWSHFISMEICKKNVCVFWMN